MIGEYASQRNYSCSVVDFNIALNENVVMVLIGDNHSQHSLQIEMTFPLKDCSIKEYTPENPNSSRHYRRTYALLWHNPKHDQRTFLMASDTEEDFLQWKEALEPFMMQLMSVTGGSRSTRVGSSHRPPIHPSAQSSATTSSTSKGTFFKKGMLSASRSPNGSKSHKKTFSFNFSGSRLSLSGKKHNRTYSADDIVEVASTPTSGRASLSMEDEANVRKEAERIRHFQVRRIRWHGGA